MKKYTILRLICTFLVALTALSCLAACGGGDWRDDVAVSSLDSAIQAKLPVPDGYYSPDSDYLEFYFEGAADLVSEYTIQISATSTNINQFGIFRVKDGEAENMKKICQTYIETSKNRWVAQANYIASEHPKMEGAEVRVFGNYVVYTMLTADDKATAFATVEELLKK